MKRWERVVPPAAGILVFLGATAALMTISIHATGGEFTYPLDDAYIHMAVAENLVRHGTWGINPGEFASVSSSPLWTALLGGVRAVFGRLETAPLVFNLIFGCLALLSFDGILRKERMRAFARTGLLTVFIFAVPLPTMALSGMEHSLQIWLTLVFFAAMSGVVGPPAALKKKREGLILALSAAALTACRYEGAFLVFAAGLVFLARRDVKRFILVGASSAFPILLFGIVSRMGGGAFLPNSLLLKGSRPELGSIDGVVRSVGGTAVLGLIRNPLLLTVFLIGLALLALLPAGTFGMKEKHRPVIFLFLATLVLHLQFSSTGWLFRYEAWLIALGMAAYCVAISGFRPPILSREARRRTAAVGLGLLASLPIIHRSYQAIQQAPLASINIYEQQRQTAELIRRHFPGETVALNDIGAVAYFTDNRILDVWGLASGEIARRKIRRTYTTEVLERLVREQHADIAVVSADFIDVRGGLPPHWDNLGEWTIRDNVVCARDTVSFYATRPEARERLMTALRSYGRLLPPSVRQRGRYLQKE